MTVDALFDYAEAAKTDADEFDIDVRSCALAIRA